MSTFDEREKSFEKKFAHDAELQFKVSARRNKHLAIWASQILRYNSDQEKEYIQSVIKADFEEAGDEDVFRKLKADLKDHNISDEEIIGFNIPTGIPLVYELDDVLRPVRHYYLGDQEEIKTAIQKVEDQAKKTN